MNSVIIGFRSAKTKRDRDGTSDPGHRRVVERPFWMPASLLPSAMLHATHTHTPSNVSSDGGNAYTTSAHTPPAVSSDSGTEQDPRVRWTRTSTRNANAKPIGGGMPQSVQDSFEECRSWQLDFGWKHTCTGAGTELARVRSGSFQRSRTVFLPLTGTPRKGEQRTRQHTTESRNAFHNASATRHQDAET
eukprot:3366306-Rhodomonas_salina.1